MGRTSGSARQAGARERASRGEASGPPANAEAYCLTIGLNIHSRFLFCSKVRVETADPEMCDFPIRRESGAGNRISGDFFASFFGRTKKEVPRRHKASGEASASAV